MNNTALRESFQPVGDDVQTYSEDEYITLASDYVLSKEWLLLEEDAAWENL